MFPRRCVARRPCGRCPIRCFACATRSERARGVGGRARFERLCHGFAGAFANIDDCARFAAAPGYMSFMLAVRFLTDHLLGDVYFKVA